MKHPNALVTTGSGGLVVFLVWLAGHLGVDLSAEDGAIAAAAVAAAALFVGRKGIRGVVRQLWRGSD